MTAAVHTQQGVAARAGCPSTVAPAGQPVSASARLSTRTRSWHARTLVGLDLETTGTDPTAARVVSAALVHVDTAGRVLPAGRQWLVDPGIEIPDEAQAVHGITTERARAQGWPPLIAIWEVLDEVARVQAAGMPLVVYNAPYDLTVLQAEAARYGLPLPGGWLSGPDGPGLVVDPLVIDRFADPGRDGPRTLQATAEAYGVTATDPHSAVGDALTACRLARAVARRHPLIGGADPIVLHGAQQGWYRDRAVHVQAMRRAGGHAQALVDKGWPVQDGRQEWFVPG